MPSDLERYEQERAQRAREQRAASRRAAKARNINPAGFDATPPLGGFSRDPDRTRATYSEAAETSLDRYRAQVALRLANLTRGATNSHRVGRGGVTESFDDTERRAKGIAKRWKRLGVLTDELAYIDSLTIAEVQDEAQAAEMRISAASDQAAAAAAEPILYHG